MPKLNFFSKIEIRMQKKNIWRFSLLNLIVYFIMTTNIKKNVLFNFLLLILCSQSACHVKVILKYLNIFLKFGLFSRKSFEVIFLCNFIYLIGMMSSMYLFIYRGYNLMKARGIVGRNVKQKLKDKDKSPQ